MNKNSNKKKLSKAEIIFYAVLAVVTVTILFWYFLKPSPGNIVEVRVSGKVVGTYLLNEDREITIEGSENGRNILIIRNGKAMMKEADCPDKICMKSRGINRVSESIICLPHEVVIEIKKTDYEKKEESAEQREDDVDVIAK